MLDTNPLDIPIGTLETKQQDDQKHIEFTDLQNDPKQPNVPQISNIQEIDKIEDDSTRLSKRQPQSSPEFQSSGFDDFFNEDNGTHHQIIESAKEGQFQPLSQSDDEDDKHFDRNHDVVNGNDCSDPKQVLNRFLGSSKKRDGDDVNWEDICMDILKFLKKPSVIITIALISILVIMTLQYNSLQREFRDLSHKLKIEQNQRGALQSQMRSVSRNVANVQKIENDLVKKENKLEKDIKDKEERDKKEKEEEKKKKEQDEKNHKENGSWGESGNQESHEIAMKPLVIHRGPPSSFFDAISRIHDKISEMHNSITQKMQGDLSGDQSMGGDADGQPHIIKIHFGNPFGGSPFGNPFSPFPTSDGPDSGGLGEPMMPHFLGLDEGDPFGP